jgi:pyruvate dehydrogenase E1 component alpha subunit
MLQQDGTLVPGARPLMDDATLLRVHDTMRLVRALDERMITLQRQGRAGFYGSCLGEEAAVLGTAAALRDTDWIVPALRQNAAMLYRGFPLTAYVGQVLGNSADLMKARQMPSHHAHPSVRQLSWSSCIANQLLHAVGIAKSIRIQGKDDVAVGYVGDGGTSEGDFHVAMNLAGLWRPPLVLVCQNNQWAISVSLDRQTLVTRIADKAAAYGVPGVRVDGNDVLAVYAAVSEAVARARAGEGPTLVEAVTFRMGGHSTSDDPTRYIEASVFKEWEKKDPLTRFRAWLEAEGHLAAGGADEMMKESEAAMLAAAAAAEAKKRPGLASIFSDVYAELPPHLVAQQEACVQHHATRGEGVDEKGEFPL